jgi:hypothetical protein
LLNNEVRLDHDKNFFTFEFASLNFSNPEENKFKYKLQGIDKGWVQNGNKNYATYTNVPPGTYIFQLKGSNNNDVWNEKITSLKIIVQPAWWKHGGSLH